MQTTARRLRELHAIADKHGRASLVYDVERTFVIEIPSSLSDRFSISYDKPSDQSESLESDDNPEERWLLENDLLTLSRKPETTRTGDSLPSLTDLSLDIAGLCNLNCVYCFEKDIKSRLGPMSEETARRSVDFLLARSGNGRSVALHFGSGEPLTNFVLLKQVVEYAEERARELHKRMNFHLTTNGTLVTREVAKFLAAHEFYVRMSIDSVYHKDTRQNLAGGSTYEAAVRGFLLLRDVLKRKLTINVVFCHGMRLKEIYEWALELGVVNLEVIKVGGLNGDSTYLTEDDVPAFRTDLRWIADDLYERALKDQRFLYYLPLTKMLRRLIGPAPTQRFCGVASTYLGTSSKGDLYPCFRHLGLENYHLGDVVNGVDDDKRMRFLSSLAQPVDLRAVCSECWARKLCGGGCYADSVVYGPVKDSPQVQHCQFWKSEAETAILLFNRLVTENPHLLFKLIGRDVPIQD